MVRKPHGLAAAAFAVALSAGWAAFPPSQALAQAPAAVPAPVPEPMIKPEGLRQISPHVWAIPDNGVGMVSNIGFIIGTNATLVVDTGLGARNGEIVLAQARKLAPNNALYIVTTHVHPEHDLGAQAFPASAKMIRSKSQLEDIAANGMNTAQAFSGRSPFIADLLKDAKFRDADITYDQAYVLDLGGVTAQMTAMGTNHTIGDTIIFVPGDRVLFSGDLAMRRGPAMGAPTATFANWYASFDKMSALNPAILVPSHAAFGGPELIDNYRKFFQAAQARTAVLKREGRTADEAARTLTTELTPFFPDGPDRIAGIVRRAYAAAP